MLAIGFLAAISLGLVGMLSGSDAGDTEPENSTSEMPVEEAVTETGNEASGVFATVDPMATDPTAGDTANAEDEAAPEVAEIVTQDTTTVEETEAEIDPARQALSLVAVVASDGTEVADDLVVEKGPETGEDADRDYVVKADEKADKIEVGYDPETTFAIEPSENTSKIIASLNSNILGTDGTDTSSTEDLFDASGNPFRETVVGKEFQGSTDILLKVDQSQVGTHVAEIDLSNPNDTLSFQFTNMMGNVHLI